MTPDELAKYLDAFRGDPFTGQIVGFDFVPASDTEPFCEPTITSDLGKYPLEITYFPPNTFEAFEPYVTICPDGKHFFSRRLFQIGGGHAYEAGASFWVGITQRPRKIKSEYSESLGEQISVGGKNAVLLKSPLPQGFGQSEILIPLDAADGYIEVLGFDFPQDELLKIAEGVRLTGVD